jgi:superfamily II DNA/RNA helicase
LHFSDLGLDAQIIRAVEESGYTTPTPIQVQGIPHALAGRDVLGIAQTGTGKTASFTLPMIHALAKGRARARMPRSLILCPTRELAAQVSENFEKYGKYHKLSMALLIGGVNFANQDKLIDRGVDVLIATPGRLLDHFERGKLMLTGIQIMVVDEADRMLDMGFIPDIEKIFGLTPFTRQTLFFSATMPPEITRLTETFLSNPVRVEVARQATAAEGVEQRVVELKPARKEGADRSKRAALRALIEGEGEAFRNAIIFCNRKRDVGVVHKSLAKYGYNAGALHGDLDQSVRTATLNAFREGEIKLLVASDVAARGLDIPNVSHIFNFDVPTHAEDYVHRIGRTGRAGRSGTAITISMPADKKYLDAIEALIEKQIPRGEAPAGIEAAEEPVRDGAEARGRARGRARERRREGAGSGAENRAAEAPAEAALPEPVAVDAAELPARSDRGGRSGKGRRTEDGRQESRGVVVGMGDHVPAFLLRPVPARRPAREADGRETDAAA